MTIEVVAFDLDGTLIDSQRDIARALNLTLRQLGRDELELVDVRKMIGGGARALLQQALGTKDADLIEEGRKYFAAFYSEGLLRETVIYPGLRATLETLSKRYVLVVATNKPTALTEGTLRGLGLCPGPIRAWASSEEVAARKPDPAVLLLAVARAGLTWNPERTVYVGDMELDVRTAAAAGTRSIGVRWGFHPEGIGSATMVIDQPDELVRTITDLSFLGAE